MAPVSLPPVGELVRFLIVGVANTAFSYALYALGLWLGLAYPLANLIAMAGGVLMGFLTQGHFVFRRLEAKRFPRFVLAWLALWGLNILLIANLLPQVNGNAYVAGAIAMVVIASLSFVTQKFLVFGGGSGR